MKKNGFTLVELLAVIVILALLITIAVPNVIKMSAKIQTNMFCSKVETIEKAAQMWGGDNYEQLASSQVTVDGVNYNSAYVIDVKSLVKSGYQKKDEEKPKDGESYVVDPRDDTSLMDKKILVYIKNSRVYADYQYDTQDDAKACKN